MRLRVTVAVSALLASSLCAQDAPRVDPAVGQVVTGGRWSSGQVAGRYRAISYQTGFEEVRHHVMLEWIQERGPTDADAVSVTLDLNEIANVYGLAEPRLTKSGSHWILTVRASARPLSQYDRTIRFELGAPGKVRRL